MSNMKFSNLPKTLDSEGLSIAHHHSDKTDFIVLKTPKGKIISLSDADVDLQINKASDIVKVEQGIQLKFFDNKKLTAMITLNKEGITIKGKKVIIESAGDKVKVNNSEFKK